MYSKIIINILLMIGLIILQLSFITGLPSFFSNLNLVIVVLILILGLGSFNMALWWAIGAGILLDVYSFVLFGTYLICLLAMILLTNFLLTNFFTNRSLYSFLALTFFAYVCYKFLLYFISYIAYFFSQDNFILCFNASFWLNELSGLIINLFAVLVGFYLLSFVSRGLKPVFLVRGK